MPEEVLPADKKIEEPISLVEPAPTKVETESQCLPTTSPDVFRNSFFESYFKRSG